MLLFSTVTAALRKGTGCCVRTPANSDELHKIKRLVVFFLVRVEASHC